MPDFALFHISDLHFGAELYPRWNRQGAPVAPTGVPLAAKLPKTQGLFPHSIAACEELENAITDEYDQLGAARNIVAATGDLMLPIVSMRGIPRASVVGQNRRPRAIA